VFGFYGLIFSPLFYYILVSKLLNMETKHPILYLEYMAQI
jgi:hypothetical protein